MLNDNWNIFINCTKKKRGKVLPKAGFEPVTFDFDYSDVFGLGALPLELAGKHIHYWCSVYFV